MHFEGGVIVHSTCQQKQSLVLNRHHNAIQSNHPHPQPPQPLPNAQHNPNALVAGKRSAHNKKQCSGHTQQSHAQQEATRATGMRVIRQSDAHKETTRRNAQSFANVVLHTCAC